MINVILIVLLLLELQLLGCLYITKFVECTLCKVHYINIAQIFVPERLASPANDIDIYIISKASHSKLAC